MVTLTGIKTRKGRVICSVCGGSFSTKCALRRHSLLHKPRESVPRHKCSLCSYESSRLDALRAHVKRMHQGMNLEPKRLEQKSPHTVASTQIADKNLESEGSEGENTNVAYFEELRSLLSENEKLVKTWRKVSPRVQDLFSFQLHGAQSADIAFDSFLRSIYSFQEHPFLLNGALGFILQNTVTGQLVFYYASANTRLLEKPVLIRTFEDLKKAARRFDELDLLEYCRQQRPNTKFVVRLVTNVLFYVDKLKSFMLGCAGLAGLPTYITNKKCIVSLTKYKKGEDFNDNLCLFRCLAYHRTGNAYIPKRIILDSYVRQYTGHTQDVSSEFPGVALTGGELERFEDFFRINVEIFTLKEQTRRGNCGTVTRGTRVRTSQKKHADTMFVNLYRNHLSYITNIGVYTSTWECRKCSKLFRRVNDMSVHENSCTADGQLLRFPDGGYGRPKSVWQELMEFGITVPTVMQYAKFRLVWDCEALSIPIESCTQDGVKKQVFLREQVIASVCICSNVPGFNEPKCLVSDGDPDKLAGSMLEYMRTVNACSAELMRAEYVDIVGEVDETIAAIIQNNSGHASGKQAALERVRKRLIEWLETLVCAGFNSGGYDLNLVRRHLFPYCIRNGLSIDRVLKRGNDYLSVRLDGLLLLDLKNYIAPGTSYSAFLAASGVKEKKGIFAYEWFDSLEKLNETKLPPREAFWSDLKQCNVSDEEYTTLQETWKNEGFQTCLDWLHWYSRLDVVPMLEAMSKLFEQWKTLNLDPFLGGDITLPGLALSYLSEAMEPHTVLPLFNNRMRDLYHTVRANIVGGLSIVMHRYHESGKTTLPNGSTCHKVISLDCNSLYCYAIGQDMGTGLFAAWRPPPGKDDSVSLPWNPKEWEGLTQEAFDRKKEEWTAVLDRNLNQGFTRCQAFPYARSELEWLEWTAYCEAIKIEHRFNGRQKTAHVGLKTRYRLDGYHPATNTAYQFLGCYFHGHGCHLDTEKDGRKREFRREQTTTCLADLAADGYRVEAKWECEWVEEKAGNRQIISFVDRHITLGLCNKSKIRAGALVRAIASGAAFGMCEVDVEIEPWNRKLLDLFEEYPPVFKGVSLSREDLSPTMRAYAEENGYMKRPSRCLVNSFFGRKLLICTPLLQWYLEHGIVITRVWQFVEMKRKRCFAGIPETVANKRREADRNPAMKSSANNWKLLGNAMFGKPCTRKENHKNTRVVPDVEATRLVNDTLFNKMTECGDVAYEVCLDKKSVRLNLPLIVSKFVLDTSKTRMLEFVYDGLKRYLRLGSFQLIASDTDSIIAAYSAPIEELIKPELQHEWETVGRENFLATDEFSQRTPGLFKVEWAGDGCAALCSKCYYLFDRDGDDKLSTKGLSKRTNNFKKEDFLRVLKTKKKGSGTNYGIRVVGDGLCQYRQEREGLAWLYAKRAVGEDGISTSALYV